jgi:hypothetical protein
VIKGKETSVREAISIIESIKGEPTSKGFKGTCETCPYACKFAGKKMEDLPAWLVEDYTSNVRIEMKGAR